MERNNIFSTNLDGEQVIDNGAFVLRRENEEIATRRKELGDKLGEAIKQTVKQSLLRTLPAYITAGIGILLGTIAFKNLGNAISYIDGDEMKEALIAFYNAIGVKLPADEFYY